MKHATKIDSTWNLLKTHLQKKDETGKMYLYLHRHERITYEPDPWRTYDKPKLKKNKKNILLILLLHKHINRN